MIGLLGDVVAGMDGRLAEGARGDGRVLRVVTDSRAVRAGDLFFAIRGARFDGHDFVGNALTAGAIACVVEQARAADVLRVCGGGAPVVIIDDVIAGLGRLAAWHRRRIGAKVIAVTGSNGKTTTKDMLHHVLSSRFRGSAAEHSFNNSLGVPLTLLGADAGDDYVVVEIGSNAPGEVATLGRMTLPDAAVVTSIGMAHVGGLGGIDGVAGEKFSLLNCLNNGGLAVAPALWRTRLGEYVDWMRNGVEDAPHEERRSICCFGLEDDAEVSDLGKERHGGTALGHGTRQNNVRIFVEESCVDGIRFSWSDGVSAHLPMPGRHHASNAGAVVAVGHWMGMSDGEIAASLSTFQPRAGRAMVRKLGGVTVIDDAYNANPTSMAGAISILADCTGRRVLICGDMGELGAESERCHEELGSMARKAGIELVVAVGKMAEVVGRGFGMEKEGRRFVAIASTGEACEIVDGLIADGDTVLVKGSRVMGLERVVAAIEARWRGALRPVH